MLQPRESLPELNLVNHMMFLVYVAYVATQTMFVGTVTW